MSRFHRQWGTTSDLLRGQLSRWWLAVAIALALAFGAAPAQAAPFAYVTSNSGPPGYVGEVFQFDIGTGGLLTPLSPATVAVGGFPGEVAVSPDGKSVYITGNSGPPRNVGEVFQFDVGADGTLSPKSPPTVTTDFFLGELAVSPDGKSVYVTASAYQGYVLQGHVLQYDVGAGGALSPKSPATVATDFEFSANGVAVSPDGKSVYVTGNVQTSPSFFGYVFQYDVGVGGQLSPKNPAAVGVGPLPLGVAVSPDGASVYVSGLSRGVSQYDVGAGGALSPKSPAAVAAGSGPGAVAVSPDGQSVYVAGSPYFYPAVGGVSQYDVGAGGALSPKSPPTVATDFSTEDLAVSPDGKSVYVTANSGSPAFVGEVFQFDVGADGALSPKSPATVAVGVGAGGVAVSPLVPTRKEQCKRGGWRDFPQFRNEGGCVSFVQKHR